MRGKPGSAGLRLAACSPRAGFDIAWEGNATAARNLRISVPRGVTMFERTRTGLREMPSNAAWLLSQALRPAEGAAAGARDRGRQVTAAVVDAAPIGDSVEIRARRAQEAAERAREAEERAVEAARESKALADHAREVSDRGHARIKDVERETSRETKQRVAEAQKAAEEFVKREREAAEADAEEQVLEVEEEVETEIAEAESNAEAAQRRAEDLVEDATEALAEARRLADEAAQAARLAAQDANRQAQELQNEAKQRASDAEARVKAVEELREQAAATAKHTARELDRETTGGGLDAYKKPELVELATTIGIEEGTNMTKGELVDAITKAARRQARQGARS
jgi:Rho termination factor, N-terminal domain